MALVGAPVALLADAMSFLASGALIGAIRRRERVEPPADADSGRRFGRDLREGARVALRDAYVRALLATTVLLNVGFNIVWGVLIVYAVRELDLGAGTVGLVLSVGEVGGLIGAAVAMRVLRRLGVGPAILATGTAFAPGLVLLAVAPRTVPLPFLAGGWAAVSLANVIYNTATVSLRQAYVPQRLQGRVVGFNRSLVWGIAPLGAIAGGALATFIGFRWTIALGAVVCLLAMVPALLSPIRSLKELPEPLEEEGAVHPLRSLLRSLWRAGNSSGRARHSGAGMRPMEYRRNAVPSKTKLEGEGKWPLDLDGELQVVSNRRPRLRLRE